jgi:hypothetical protein
MPTHFSNLFYNKLCILPYPTPDSLHNKILMTSFIFANKFCLSIPLQLSLIVLNDLLTLLSCGCCQAYPNHILSNYSLDFFAKLPNFKLPVIHNTLLLVLPCPSAKFISNISQPNTIYLDPPTISYHLQFGYPIRWKSRYPYYFPYKISPELHRSFSTHPLTPIFSLHTSISTHTPSHIHLLKSSPSCQVFLLSMSIASKVWFPFTSSLR